MHARLSRLVAGLVAVLLLGLAIGCASVDRFNAIAAEVTHEAILASEQHRCGVHPSPCLNDEQFKSVNAELYKVSVAGREFTKLRIAGASTAADVSTFLAVVSQETQILAQAFPDGRIGSVLAKLIDLQAKAVALLGAKG